MVLGILVPSDHLVARLSEHADGFSGIDGQLRIEAAIEEGYRNSRHPV
jgi:hypothetical protein